jgi:hypothetical protein
MYLHHRFDSDLHPKVSIDTLQMFFNGVWAKAEHQSDFFDCQHLAQT